MGYMYRMVLRRLSSSSTKTTGSIYLSIYLLERGIYPSCTVVGQALVPGPCSGCRCATGPRSRPSALTLLAVFSPFRHVTHLSLAKSMSHVRKYKDVCIGISPHLLALRLRDEIRGSTALFLLADVLARHPFL
jgi:hypothetical protein